MRLLNHLGGDLGADPGLPLGRVGDVQLLEDGDRRLDLLVRVTHEAASLAATLTPVVTTGCDRLDVRGVSFTELAEKFLRKLLNCLRHCFFSF